MTSFASQLIPCIDCVRSDAVTSCSCDSRALLQLLNPEAQTDDGPKYIPFPGFPVTLVDQPVGAFRYNPDDPGFNVTVVQAGRYRITYTLSIVSDPPQLDALVLTRLRTNLQGVVSVKTALAPAVSSDNVFLDLSAGENVDLRVFEASHQIANLVILPGALFNMERIA